MQTVQASVTFKSMQKNAWPPHSSRLNALLAKNSNECLNTMHLKRDERSGEAQLQLYNKLIFDVSKVSLQFVQKSIRRRSCPRTFRIQKVMHFASSFLSLSRLNLVGVK